MNWVYSDGCQVNRVAIWSQTKTTQNKQTQTQTQNTTWCLLCNQTDIKLIGIIRCNLILDKEKQNKQQWTQDTTRWLIGFIHCNIFLHFLPAEKKHKRKTQILDWKNTHKGEVRWINWWEWSVCECRILGLYVNVSFLVCSWISNSSCSRFHWDSVILIPWLLISLLSWKLYFSPLVDSLVLCFITEKYTVYTTDKYSKKYTLPLIMFHRREVHDIYKRCIQ